jgi:hypothetical protein
MAVFGQKSTFRQAWSIRYSRTKHAIRFYLRNQTTAKTEYLMGSSVNNLSEFWVYKPSFFNRHPSIEKGKKWNTAHFCSEKRNIPSVDWTPPLWLIKYMKKSGSKLQIKYGIELPPIHTEYLMVSTVNNLVKFWVYKLSFTKRRMIQIFSKKTCPTYPVIMGPLLTN